MARLASRCKVSVSVPGHKYKIRRQELAVKLSSLVVFFFVLPADYHSSIATYKFLIVTLIFCVHFSHSTCKRLPGNDDCTYRFISH